jgi:hypothetical protein
VPPTTDEEVQAERQLNDKLQGFFAAETGQSDTAREAPEAEEAPAAEADTTAEAEAETEQPRDEQGRFLPREGETAEQQEERLLAGKYKTTEDLERAYTELQSLHGRSSQELGELRRAMEERLDALQQGQQPQYDYEGLIDEDPAYAVQLAYQQRDEAAFRRAWEAWEEMSPGTPTAWWEATQAREEYRQLAQYVQQGMQPVQQMQAQTEWDQTAAEFAKQHPAADNAAVYTEMQRQAEQYPHMLTVLQTGAPEARLEVLDFLYTKAEKAARDRGSDTLATAQQQQAAQQRDQARAAKLDAGVTTATTAPTERPPIEAWRENFRKVLFDTGTTISSGLTRDE